MRFPHEKDRNQHGSLVVGASTTPGIYVLPRIIGRFRAAYPGITLSLQIANSLTIEERVRAAHLEVGIGGGHLLAAGAQCLTAGLVDELVLIVPPNHAWARFSSEGGLPDLGASEGRASAWRRPTFLCAAGGVQPAPPAPLKRAHDGSRRARAASAGGDTRRGVLVQPRPGCLAPLDAALSPDQPALRTVLHTPGVFLMGVTSALLTAIQTGVLVFLFPLYLLTRGGLGPEAVGAVVSLSVLGRLMTLWLGGTVSDRWGRIRVLIPGLLVYAVVLAGMSQLTQPVALALCSFASGAAAGFVAVVPTTLTSDLVQRPLQGIAIGWLRTMSDSGQIGGPLVMGALADAIDLSTPFLFGAALLGVTAWVCHRRANAMADAAGGRDS